MAVGLRVDMEKVRGALHGRTREIAEEIGIIRVSLARRLNKQLPLEELNEICHYLGRDATEFVETYQTTDEEMQERREKRDKLKVRRGLVEENDRQKSTE